MKTNQRIEALAKFLEISAEKIEESGSGGYEFSADGAEYLVLTDDEADDRTKSEMQDCVGSFVPSFLAAHSDADEEVFKALQDTGKCEDLNKPIRSLIRDWDHFVSAAIKADGRGHHLSPYDGKEHEVKVNGKQFFIYRVN